MVNKASPLYPEYMRECEKMAEELNRREDEIDAQRKQEKYKGLDDPRIAALRKEFSVRLKEIKKKYGFD